MQSVQAIIPKYGLLISRVPCEVIRVYNPKELRGGVCHEPDQSYESQLNLHGILVVRNEPLLGKSEEQETGVD